MNRWILNNFSFFFNYLYSTKIIVSSIYTLVVLVRIQVYANLTVIIISDDLIFHFLQNRPFGGAVSSSSSSSQVASEETDAGNDQVIYHME